jgi:hypothetical protein
MKINSGQPKYEFKGLEDGVRVTAKFNNTTKIFTILTPGKGADYSLDSATCTKIADAYIKEHKSTVKVNNKIYSVIEKRGVLDNLKNAATHAVAKFGRKFFNKD